MTGQVYYRPIAQTDRCRPDDALSLAGGWAWFSHVERLERGQAGRYLPVRDVPQDVVQRLSSPREPLFGLSLDVPRIMGILNATPDSFSDGGQYDGIEAAVARGHEMAGQGADILDIGGESTRPGADTVDVEEEIARTVPVISSLRAGGFKLPISIDTRKAVVADAALGAGANLFNDVTALSYDADSLPVAVKRATAVCLMHAQGDPKTMQKDPQYDDVVLDVYDYLEARLSFAETKGLPRLKMIVDVGIGFGKTIEHNLKLIRSISLFHGLGCAILIGVSRKGFIGLIGNAQNAAERMPGSVALALETARQGVQILRVHDIVETRQAFELWKSTF